MLKVSSARCAALLFLVAGATSTSCGSRNDLSIGHNQVPSGANGGGGGGDVDPHDAAPDANPSDASVDAPVDAESDSAVSDAAAGAGGACPSGDVAPPGSLLHRYSFDGTGTVAKDSIGTANGDLKPGATLDGKGLLTLDGMNGYVNLPNHLISVLTDVTIVTWATFLGGSGYQRIFDFGVGQGEDDTTGQGQSYLAVAPFGGTSRLLMLARKSPTDPEIQITSSADINDHAEHQVALVFVSASHAELYLDGQLLGRTPIPFSLSDIDDVNDWIGRSQWNNDHVFNGTVDEFRIYGAALSPCAIQALDDAGPNAF